MDGVGGIAADAAGCCAHATTDDYPPGGSDCRHPVAWAGVVSFTYPKRETVRAFACDLHKELLTNPQVYGSNLEHLAEMERRLAARFSSPPTD